jgi:hypothetical protein
MLKKLVIGCTIILMGVHVWAAATLDGTSWTVRVVPDAAAKKAGEHAFRDTLIFKDGEMTAKDCLKYGFEPAPYKMGDASGMTSFQSTQVSLKEGTDVWSGTVNENRVQGNLIWTKTDGKTLNYTFKGTRK